MEATESKEYRAGGLLGGGGREREDAVSTWEKNSRGNIFQKSTWMSLLEKKLRMQGDFYGQTLSSRPEHKGCWREMQDWTRVTAIKGIWRLGLGDRGLSGRWDLGWSQVIRNVTHLVWAVAARHTHGNPSSLRDVHLLEMFWSRDSGRWAGNTCDVGLVNCLLLRLLLCRGDCPAGKINPTCKEK